MFTTGLTPEAAAQNRRVGRVDQSLKSQEGQAQSSSPAATTASNPGADGVTASAKLSEDIGQFEVLLSECKRSLALEHLEVGDAAAQRRAEEQRQRNADRQRRLRDEAKQAQNPKRRIELRLTQTREFGADPGALAVPMRPVVMESKQKTVKIPMPDVPAIQARCQGLMAGNSPGVPGLLEAQARREVEQGWLSRNGVTGSSHNFIRANMDPTGPLMQYRRHSKVASRLEAQEARAAKRQAAAKQRRGAKDEERWLKSVKKIQEDWIAHMEKQGVTTARAAMEDIAAKTDGNSAEVILRSLARRSSLGLEAQALRGPILGRRSSVARRASCAAETVEAEPTGPSPRARQLFHVFCSVLMFSTLLPFVRTRRKAADAIWMFMSQLEENRRLRDGTRGLIMKVRGIQQACRARMERKRRWIANHGPVWQQFEDQHLQAHHRRERIKQLQSSEDQDAVAMSKFKASAVAQEWKVLRIPLHQRRFVMGRWYMDQMRRSVQVKQAWFVTFRLALAASRDVKHFVDLCAEGSASVGQVFIGDGTDDGESSVVTEETAQAADPSRTTVAPPAPPKGPKVDLKQPAEVKDVVVPASTAELPSTGFEDMLQFGEREVLELIAEAAKDMVKENPLFAEHPANKAVRRARAPPSSRYDRQRRKSAWQQEGMAKLTDGDEGAAGEAQPQDIDGILNSMRAPEMFLTLLSDHS